jgi:predicted nucleic acid-binding protein
MQAESKIIIPDTNVFIQAVEGDRCNLEILEMLERRELTAVFTPAIISEINEVSNWKIKGINNDLEGWRRIQSILEISEQREDCQPSQPVAALITDRKDRPFAGAAESYRLPLVTNDYKHMARVHVRKQLEEWQVWVYCPEQFLKWCGHCQANWMCMKDQEKFNKRHCLFEITGR